MTASTEHSAHADPHAGHGHGHGDPGAFHPHVVPVKGLAAVITALLVLTVVTYLAAKIELGGSLNIIVAMAIATVKATLVVAFFMHLWWDKAINTLVLLFSLSLLALFLSFSILDTHEYKASVVPDFAQKAMDAKRSAAPAAATPAVPSEPGTGHGTGDQGAAPTPPGPSAQEVAELRKWAKRTFGTPPLPAQADTPKNPITPEKVALGRTLYFDPRLSKNQDLSCNSCHELDKYGIDGREKNAVSAGHKGQMGTRNSPTVYNAALHSSQFWDGREPTVEAQAKGPMTNPVEMAMADHDTVVKVVKSIPGYQELWKQAYPDQPQITIDGLANAIGAFERKLITPAPFDRWLEGEDGALSGQAVRGLQVYKEVNCNMCHMGNLLGGNMQQKLGLMSSWEGNPDDGAMFKVPSLRNVAKTGPYLHDGSIASLEEVTVKMAKYQLGKDLSPDQTKALLAFMESLTGDLPPAELIGKPELPPSGPETPKPDPN